MLLRANQNISSCVMFAADGTAALVSQTSGAKLYTPLGSASRSTLKVSETLLLIGVGSPCPVFMGVQGLRPAISSGYARTCPDGFDGQRHSQPYRLLVLAANTHWEYPVTASLPQVLLFRMYPPASTSAKSEHVLTIGVMRLMQTSKADTPSPPTT